MSSWLDDIKWNDAGLIPVIVQETESLKVLMHAWMNRAALEKTTKEGKAVYWSRSRQSFWTKGELSGHFQHVESIHMDCDADTLLLTVEQEGGIACHTGRHNCFFMQLENGAWQTTEKILKPPKKIFIKNRLPMKKDTLTALDELLEKRKRASLDESYTAKLLADGLDNILKKVGEESVELIIASKSGDDAAIIHEIADLWFHTMVLLKHHNLNTPDILKELEGRFGLSGLEEKANRQL